MRYAVIADIHANLAAFSAVLTDIDNRGGTDEFWCLGDTVGYGPDPHECLEELRQRNHVSVTGNHDWGAIDRVSLADFNPDAAIACRWTAGRLTAEDRGYLESCPVTLTRGDFTLAHGSPREPIWEYVVSARVAAENFAYFSSSFCLVGHSHIPLVSRETDGEEVSFSPLTDNSHLALKGDRMIINPGSVGQPRDGDPRASYGVINTDDETFELYRVTYDISLTQKRMAERHLPEWLITRLGMGR